MAANLHPDLSTITLGKTQAMMTVLAEWGKKFGHRLQGFNDIIETRNLNRKVANAYADYTKYVFHYRLLNNLPNNILFRKILSFEIHFFCKHGILHMPNGVSQYLNPNPSDNERLLYLRPYAHFLYYRIQKEFHLRLPPAADMSESLQLVAQVTNVIRSNIEEFFSEYSNGNKPGLDDFRAFLESRQDTTNIRAIIDYIEKEPYQAL